MRILAYMMLLCCSLQAAPEMNWPADLDPRLKNMLENGLKTYDAHPTIPYKTASSSIQEGMDCSGAMLFLLQKIQIVLPRSSPDICRWLKNESMNFTIVPETAHDIADPVYKKLRPGDLIFWAKNDTDASTFLTVSHVHMYLGEEKSDGHRVMIGSSAGRSYRGRKRSGFGIVDFRVPAATGKTRIVAFGSIPLPTTP